MVGFPFFGFMFGVLFVGGAALPYGYEGVWVLYGFGFVNVYVWMLQYLYYTPST